MSQIASRSAAETKPAAATRELTFQDGASSKFWTISLDGCSHIVRFGRTGTQGQTQTKEFASEADARKSFDKLVAEKLKKGYTDAASGSATSTAASTPSKPVKRAGKTKAAEAEAEADPAAVAPASPSSQVDLAVTRSINLAPADWLRATFRPRQPQPRPEATPFDLDACLEKLSKLRTDTYGWEIRWRDLNLPAVLAREEAHFWLEAMTKVRDNTLTPKGLADKLSKKEFDGQLSAADVGKMLEHYNRNLPELAAVPLVNLLRLEDLPNLFPKQSATPHAWKEATALAVLARGFINYVLPHLADGDATALRESLRRRFDPTQSPAPNSYQALPAEYYLAAMLGMHEEAYAVTSTWADDRFSQEEWSDHYQRPQDIVFGLGSPELVESEWRRLKLRMRTPEHVRAFLACTEYAALDCVSDSILAETNKEKCQALAEAFTLVHAPEAAEPMLACKLGSKAPSVARDWLDINLGCAIAGLVGVAAGRGKLAAAALDFLRDAKRLGHGSLVASAAKDLTDAEAVARIEREVLSREEKTYQPLDDATTPDWLRQALADSKTKSRKLPGWAQPALLPPLAVGDRRLNDSQVVAVLQALAATPVSTRHPLLTALVEHVDGACRDEFAWKLFQSWAEDGAAPKEKWAMGAIGHIGGDGCALRLTPLVRAWPGESQHQRAVFGLECLRAIGSDAALMQLAGVAQKLKFKGLKAKAEQFVNEIAAERGMTRAELEDRVVPDCGLDEQGRREFSFGPRVFSFVLSSDLKPMVRDGDGKVRGDLPKPGAKDDAALAQQSVAAWKLLKKQIREVAQLQAGRLEQAMVTGRRWKVADFETLLARHPLLVHLVRQLVWGAFAADGRKLATFRVTDESDYADVADNATSLAEAATVGVVHPLELEADERSAWGEVLSDYEIVSPFAQLGRAAFALEVAEADDRDVKRFHGTKLLAPTLVFTLEKLGWIRGTAMDGGCFDEHSKQYPAADVTAVVGYEGNVGMGYIDPNETLKITTVHFVSGMRPPSGYGWGSKETLRLGQVAPVVISEVLADLQVLKSKSK